MCSSLQRCRAYIQAPASVYPFLITIRRIVVKPSGETRNVVLSINWFFLPIDPEALNMFTWRIRLGLGADRNGNKDTMRAEEAEVVVKGDDDFYRFAPWHRDLTTAESAYVAFVAL